MKAACSATPAKRARCAGMACGCSPAWNEDTEGHLDEAGCVLLDEAGLSSCLLHNLTSLLAGRGHIRQRLRSEVHRMSAPYWSQQKGSYLQNCRPLW